MIRYAAVLLYAVSAVALGASENISRVNGSIEVEPGRQAGDVETVNGSIIIGSGARVREVETVNGSVRLEARAEAQAVQTVNGGVTVGEEAVVRDEVSAVNGKVTLQRAARVEGRVENVNGALRLEGATVGAGLGTVNGDVFVGAGSQLDGGIEIEKPSGWSWSKPDRPRVTIESGATVNGTLRFEREVDLYVGAGAVVGPIEGVEPRRSELP